GRAGGRGAAGRLHGRGLGDRQRRGPGAVRLRDDGRGGGREGRGTVTLVKYSVQLTDVSDRATRLLGFAGFESQGPASDGMALSGVRTWRNDSGGTGGPVVTSSAFNGTTMDLPRNLQAGAPKYALGVGDPRDAVAHGGAYYGVGIVAQAVAAINQMNVVRIRNPAASGVVVYVTYLAVLCTEAR